MALGAIGGGIGASGIASGLSKGLTAGLTGTAGTVARGALTGAFNSALTQGIGTATGLQDKFSWSGVAAAGVAGGSGPMLEPSSGTRWWVASESSEPT